MKTTPAAVPPKGVIYLFIGGGGRVQGFVWARAQLRRGLQLARGRRKEPGAGLEGAWSGPEIREIDPGGGPGATAWGCAGPEAPGGGGVVTDSLGVRGSQR